MSSPVTSRSNSVATRNEDIQWTAARIMAGQSCCLVGVADVGVTHTAKALTSPAVQESIFLNAENRPHIVWVDLHLLQQFEPKSFFSLVIHRVAQSLQNASLKNLPLDSMLRSIAAPSDSIERADAPEKFLSFVSIAGTANINLCIVFDPFDHSLEKLDTSTLLRLRAARDQCKPRLSYLICTTQAPDRLRSDVSVDPFLSLFLGRVRFIRPMSATESDSMIESLVRARSTRISNDLRKQLVIVSGGHPGLIQVLFEVTYENAPRNQTDIWSVSRFLEADGVIKECNAIVSSLTRSELDALLHLSETDSRADAAIDSLLRKGMLVQDASRQLQLFSPLVAEYLMSHFDASHQTLSTDFATGTVRRGSEDLTGKLTPTEHRLLLYLAKHPGEACTKDDIAVALWPDEAIHGLGDDRIQKTVDRLRAKLSANYKPSSSYIQTIRGRGYRFVSDAEGQDE